MGLDPNLQPAATHRQDCPRRYPRVLFSVPLTIHHLVAGGTRRSPGVCLDISEGGMGALVQDGLHLGETVKIDLKLPGDMISAVAIVRHSSSVLSGFEFVGLSAEERSRIMHAAANC